MEALKELVENAKIEADGERDKFRIEQLSSIEFRVFASLTFASLLSLFFVLSASQIQSTADWQYFVVWACMIMSGVVSIVAIFAPDRIRKIAKSPS